MVRTDLHRRSFGRGSSQARDGKMEFQRSLE